MLGFGLKGWSQRSIGKVLSETLRSTSEILAALRKAIAVIGDVLLNGLKGSETPSERRPGNATEL